MAGNDVIQDRLNVLRNEVAYLKGERDAARAFADYATNVRLKKAVERSLHVAIEACLDIGRRVISLAGFRYPESNQDVFQVLNEAQVVPHAQLPHLTQMARFRNLVVHDYARIDDTLVYEVLQHQLEDFDAFATAIVGWLDHGSRTDS